MSLASDVALGAAERVRKNLGARAGLLSYRGLAGSTPDSEARGRAVLGGLACALELDDEASADALVGLYAAVTTGLFEEEVRRVVLAMLARADAGGRTSSGWSLSATGLAALEAERFPRARAAYLHARCLERAGDSGACEALRRAEERATREGAQEIVQSARALRAAVLYERGEVDGAASLAASLSLRSLSPELVFRLAPFGLDSESRFARSAWVGELAERVADGEPEVAAQALALACAHADAMGLALTPMEEDRLFAVFGRVADLELASRLSGRLRARRALAPAAREGDVEATLRALAEATPPDARALACARRAADVVRGRFEPRAPLPEGDAVALAASACAALRDAERGRAASALARLATELEAAPPGERAPAWEAAYLGLHSDAEAVQREAVGVVAALVRLRAPLPPRGGVAMARVCRAVSSEESGALALALLLQASAVREEGAAEAYLEGSLELGWRAAQAGEREVALRWLREARRVSRR